MIDRLDARLTSAIEQQLAAMAKAGAQLPEFMGQMKNLRAQTAAPGAAAPVSTESQPVRAAAASSDDEAGEDAEPAAAPETVEGGEGSVSAGAPDDEGFVWPEGARQADGAPVQDEPSDVAKAEAPLPPLGELENRIPAAVRETMEELFRARFTSVKRVSAKTLKAKPKA